MPFLEIIINNNLSNYIRFIGVKRKKRKKKKTQQKHLSVSTNDNTSH